MMDFFWIWDAATEEDLFSHDDRPDNVCSIRLVYLSENISSI